MELVLQFGYGMIDHCRSLIKGWGGGTVVLSPRDLSPHQLLRVATDITAAGGTTLVDPQFYLPTADHERLLSHDYWPRDYDSGTFWSGTELRALLTGLLALNRSLGTSAVLLPGLFAEKVDDDWLARTKLTIDEATAAAPSEVMLASIALGADTLRSDDDVDRILAAAEDWNVPGVYLVCEHPGGDYLVRDASWMANILDLVAGLRVKGKTVMLGYSSHQLLAAAAAGADAIASGTWMNVRSFPPDKFRAQYEDEIKQRTVWYYCPAALSEFKIPFLDIAKKQGALEAMEPPPLFTNQYSQVLFAGAQPSSVGWTEQAAFRHYLSCLRTQVGNAAYDGFDETVDRQVSTLDAAESLLEELHLLGVRGQFRDFSDSIDVNRAALAVLRKTRGPVLRRRWSGLRASRPCWR